MDTEDQLYGETVKALAASAFGAGRLADAQGRGRAASPLCGDRADIEVRLAADGTIAALAHQVRGCLVCRAAAAALAQAAPGQAAESVAAAHRALAALLTASVTPPEPFAGLPAFAAFQAFAPLRRHRARHECALVPLRAAEAAVAQAQAESRPVA